MDAWRMAAPSIEKAQQLANRESPRTTKLYDRTGDQITPDEVEGIVFSCTTSNFKKYF